MSAQAEFIIHRERGLPSLDMASEARYLALYRRATTLARIGVWECDLATSAHAWSDGVYDLFGIPRGSPLDRNTILDLYEPDSRCELEWLRSRAIRECGGFTLDARVRTTDGSPRWMRVIAAVESVGGIARRLYGTKQDVTEENRLADQLRLLAESDALTMLANRASFERWLRGDGCIGTVGAVVLVDIDRFKAINDINGHGAGDACLRHVADCLREAFDDARLVARIGGDEFAVLLPEDATLRRIGWRVAEFLDSLDARPLAWNGKAIGISASAGIALASLAHDGRDALFALADAALYAAKAAGRNTFRLAGVGQAGLRRA
jgi:diguanylate cyclase (GGDEF)-like protein